MSSFYLHNNNGYFIRKNSNLFYVNTKEAAGCAATGLPGPVSSFSFTESSSTDISSDVSFSWVAPSYDGGSAVTGYVIYKVPAYKYNTDNVSGVVNWSGYHCLNAACTDAILEEMIYNDSANPTTITITGCGPVGFQIAAINCSGEGPYMNDTGLTSYGNGWLDIGGVQNILCRQASSTTVYVTWTSGLVSCTGAYYQGEIRVFDYSTLTDTGVKLNTVNQYNGTVNLSSLAKNKYYYVTVREYHYVGVNPTGCSELIQSCDTTSIGVDGFSNLFWYAGP